MFFIKQALKEIGLKFYFPKECSLLFIYFFSENYFPIYSLLSIFSLLLFFYPNFFFYFFYFLFSRAHFFFFFIFSLLFFFFSLFLFYFPIINSLSFSIKSLFPMYSGVLASTSLSALSSTERPSLLPSQLAPPASSHKYEIGMHS